jgi:hypothetical protein
MAKAEIKVTGLDKTIRALRIIDPEAMKALRVGFRSAANPILEKARERVPDRPLRNYGRWTAWYDGRDLSWNPEKARRGMTSRVTTGRRNAGLQLISRHPAAAMYENAGSKNMLKTTRADRVNQARAFNTLANKAGEPPRLLVGTWKQEKGIKQTYIAVGRLIQQAEARVQEAMR